MDITNLWKHCYSFSHVSFDTVYNYRWLTAIASATVSLRHLPECLRSTVTCRDPIRWFQINPDSTPEKTESLCYEQKHMTVLIWIKTIIEYWRIYSPSSKLFSSATQLLTYDHLFVAQDVVHNVGNILRSPLMISLTNFRSALVI